MPSKRSVWILDIHDFLKYLETAFSQLGSKFPWLLDTRAIDQNYPWTATQRFTEHRTQRDELIDWLIRKYLAEMHYIDQGLDEYSPEFNEVLDYLWEHHDYPRQARQYFWFPFLVGHLHAHAIYRQSIWLYVDLTYNPHEQLR
jgi:hypothetical protein